MQTSVLIITEREDVHGHALIWALNRAGIHCDRWSTSDFPEEQRTSVRILNSSSPPSFQIAGLSQPYHSIWMLHGSYDFVEQPDGSMVFVEINEMGQFL